MLVLTRKQNEVVNIYTRMPDGKPGMFVGSVMVIEVRGDKVRLGFDMPMDVLILRESVDEWKGKVKPLSHEDKKGES